LSDKFLFVLSLPNLGFSNINCMENFQSTEYRRLKSSN